MEKDGLDNSSSLVVGWQIGCPAMHGSCSHAFSLHGWQGDRGAGLKAKLWLLPLPPGRSFSVRLCQVLPRDLIISSSKGSFCSVHQ